MKQSNLARAIRRAWILAAFVFASPGCRAPVDFGGDEESKGLTYEQYVSERSYAGLDPVGATDIYYRCVSTRDSRDSWWRVAIGPEDCERLITSPAAANGKTAAKWSSTTDYPPRWKSHGEPPAWWNRSDGIHAKSAHWCYPAGAGERHEGWYFLYDPDAKTLWIWRWDHQWSSAQCD
jgi:hypothetical protein